MISNLKNQKVISQILVTKDSNFILTCGFDVNFILWKVIKPQMKVEQSQKLSGHQKLVISLVFAKNES